MTLKNFIVFEGLDGSGQSTQADILKKRLQKDGHKVLLTKEPTNNIVGGLIRGALTREWKPSNQAMQLLYSADRLHHLDREIKPALDDGYIVISDRYYFSSIAYGSLTDDINWLESINAKAPNPQIAFFFDTKAETSMDRIGKSRHQTELYEEVAKLTKVRQTYLEIAKKYPFFSKIDGEKDIESISDLVYKAVKSALKI